MKDKNEMEFLTGLILASAELTKTNIGTNLSLVNTGVSNKGILYLVGQKVAEAGIYSVYICKDNNTSQSHLLQIASDPDHNSSLDRAAFILKELKTASDLCEEEYSKTNPGKLLNYDRLFPTLLDSFISPEQGNCRVNILSFKDIDTINKMVPLSSLRVKDKLRISLETSAWIMGRLLKLIAFIHEQAISVDQMDGNNLLVCLEQHFLVMFDWSQAQTGFKEVPLGRRCDDISNAARAIFLAIGGDINTGIYPYESNHEYPKFLWQLALRNNGDALKTHTQFYAMVNRIFGYKFIPSKLLPLDGTKGVMKNG